MEADRHFINVVSVTQFQSKLRGDLDSERSRNLLTTLPKTQKSNQEPHDLGATHLARRTLLYLLYREQTGPREAK